jgi:hypothetical protein
MKRKITAIVLTLALCAAMTAGCGKTDVPASSPAQMPATYTPAADTYEEDGYDEYDYDEYYESEEYAAQEQPAAVEETPVAAEEQFIEFEMDDGILYFSEGLAWVPYTEFGTKKYAVIDKTGRTIYTTDIAVGTPTMYQDGVSLVNINTDNDRDAEGFQIIDNTGKVLYSHNDSDEHTIAPVGYVNGHFLIVEHVSNFDSNVWQFGTIDKLGNRLIQTETLPEGYTYSESPTWDNVRLGTDETGDTFYLGDDWTCFAFSSYHPYALNLTSGEVRLLNPAKDSRSESVIYEIRVIDGYAFVRSESWVYKMTLTELLNGNSSFENNALARSSDYDTISEGLYFSNYRRDKLTDGKTYFPEASGAYYDLSGNAVVTFPEYEGRYFSGGAFIGAYAGMYIRGADGADYVTVIDKTGARQYEPVKVFDFSSNNLPYSAALSSAHSYMIAPTEQENTYRAPTWSYLGPDGRTVIPGVDDLSTLSSGTHPGLVIYDGVITVGLNQNGDYGYPLYSYYGDIKSYSHINLATNETIDKVRIPASQFNLGTSEQSNESVIAASSYTGSFSLAGMWKMGESIFTFSDSGAVNALFFGFGGGGPDGSWTMSSKADENGHYTLSASHITGGSPVYKVRLISKDEIELYGESGIDFGAQYYHLYRP